MNNSRTPAKKRENGVRQLRVLFDGHWLESGPPSGRSVLRGILSGWEQSYPQDVLTIRVPRNERLGAQTPFMPHVKRLNGSHFSMHAASVMTTRPDVRDFDVYISQNFGAPLGSALRCSFLHDGLYKEHPEWFSMTERLYLSLIRPSLIGTRIVFTSSHAEADRISRLWPGLRPKVIPVGLALPSWVNEAPARRPSEVFATGRPYLLTVGRLNVRKNLARLIDAYEQSTASQSHDLLIVGEPNGVPAVSSSSSSRIRFLKGISDSELKWLYENASAFVFPSLDEGFGLPLIESAYFGLNIAVSDIPVFRELGLASHYFDPLSVDDIAKSLDLLIMSEQHVAVERQAYSDWSAVVGSMRKAILQTLDRDGK